MFFVQLVTERKSIKTNSFSTTINKWECATQTAAQHSAPLLPPIFPSTTTNPGSPRPCPSPCSHSPSAVPIHTSAARCCFLPWRFLCPSGADHLFFCAEHFVALHKRPTPKTAYSKYIAYTRPDTIDRLPTTDNGHATQNVAQSGIKIDDGAGAISDKCAVKGKRDRG